MTSKIFLSPISPTLIALVGIYMGVFLLCDCEKNPNAITSPPEPKVFVDSSEKDSLLFLKPHFRRIDLAYDKMPSARDSNVILVVAAAFTGEKLNQFRHSNIAGDHVAGGQRHRGYSCKRNTGAFVFYNGKYKFLYKDYSAELDSAALHGGYGFAQEMIVHEGEFVHSVRPDNNRNLFRALCEMDAACMW